VHRSSTQEALDNETAGDARPGSASSPSRENASPTIGGPSYEHLVKSTSEEEKIKTKAQAQPPPHPWVPQSDPPIPTTHDAHSQHLTAYFTSVSTPNVTPARPVSRSHSKRHRSHSRSGSGFCATVKSEEILPMTKGPKTTPILRPVHRYCRYEQIVKPYRTHHCSVCAKVCFRKPFALHAHELTMVSG
jgi:palmitoyltransferase